MWLWDCNHVTQSNAIFIIIASLKKKMCAWHKTLIHVRVSFSFLVAVEETCGEEEPCASISDNILSYNDPGIGLPLLCLWCQAGGFFFLLFLIESGMAVCLKNCACAIGTSLANYVRTLYVCDVCLCFFFMCVWFQVVRFTRVMCIFDSMQ